MEENKYQWDFKEFFSSDEEFLQSLDSLKKERTKLEENIKEMPLIEQLKSYYDLVLKGEKLITYSELHSDLDVSNETYISYKDQAYQEKEKLNIIKDFINQEVLKIDVSLEDYLKEHPELKPFKMCLYDILRLKSHNITTSAIRNESSLITKVNSLYTTIMNVELPCETITIHDETVKVNGSTYNKYCTNQDREIRKQVFDAYMKTLSSVNKSISGLFIMRYQLCSDIAKEKGYTSILEQVIHEDDLDEKMIDELIHTVHSNLNLFHRYLELKKKQLNLEELHYYDFKINEEYNPHYTFEEGISILKEALKVLGPTYQEKLNTVLSGGMLDVFPSEYKFKGGYHFRNYTKPMILMNYKGNFGEVPTIAHEIGHAINGLFIKENQEFQNFHFATFLSEIASTVNEDRVEKYFYDSADKETKKIHLEQILDKTVVAIFYQTMFLEFQKELCSKIEQGKTITADIINTTFLEKFKMYYQTMVIDENIKYMWQTRLHLFYTIYRYYNFQYATSKIIALVINKNIDEGHIEEYLEFLKVGGSKTTLEALKVAGVDLTKQETYQNAMDYLKDLLDEYELLLK